MSLATEKTVPGAPLTPTSWLQRLQKQIKEEKYDQAEEDLIFALISLQESETQKAQELYTCLFQLFTHLESDHLQLFLDKGWGPSSIDLAS